MRDEGALVRFITSETDERNTRILKWLVSGYTPRLLKSH